MRSLVDFGPAGKNTPGVDREVVSLARAKPGREYQVVGIAGGCDVQLRLASLGLLPGQKIRIIQPSDFGPVMVLVKKSKLALGRGVSFKVLVRPIGEVGLKNTPAENTPSNERTNH